MPCKRPISNSRREKTCDPTTRVRIGKCDGVRAAGVQGVGVAGGGSRRIRKRLPRLHVLGVEIRPRRRGVFGFAGSMIWRRDNGAECVSCVV